MVLVQLFNRLHHSKLNEHQFDFFLIWKLLHLEVHFIAVSAVMYIFRRVNSRLPYRQVNTHMNKQNTRQSHHSMLIQGSHVNH